MRYVTVSVTPSEGASFHPLSQALADPSDITRGAVHRVELIADGTGAMLAEARADRERDESILNASESVHQYAVPGPRGVGAPTSSSNRTRSTARCPSSDRPRQ